MLANNANAQRLAQIPAGSTHHADEGNSDRPVWSTVNATFRLICRIRFLTRRNRRDLLHADGRGCRCVSVSRHHVSLGENLPAYQHPGALHTRVRGARVPSSCRRSRIRPIAARSVLATGAAPRRGAFSLVTPVTREMDAGDTHVWRRPDLREGSYGSSLLSDRLVSGHEPNSVP